MRYIVAMKVCYRDVKMRNLLICPDTLQVKIKDIGISTCYPTVDELRQGIDKVSIQPIKNSNIGFWSFLYSLIS